MGGSDGTAGESVSTQLTPRGKKGCLGCGGAMALLILISLLHSTNSPERPNFDARHVGSRGFLRVGNGEPVLIASTKDAFDQMTKAAIAGDTVGLRQLMLAGLVRTVPSGTRVLVIDQGMYTRQVRFESGDLTGQTAWIAYEHIQAR